MYQLSTHLVEIHNLCFRCGNQIIFDNISLTIQKEKITAIIGPSGIGKTTLLRLIGGQLYPDSGEIWFDGKNIHELSRTKLYEIRKRMSMLFQSGALFTDLNIYENVAWPLREHTCLPPLILHSVVIMKLEAVGLRCKSTLMPSELSGGMVRRAALARSIALDPELIMLDEPFVGQDPVTMNSLIKLIDKLNYSLGITCIIVSHDIPEVFSIAHYVYILDEKKIIAQGTINSLQENSDPKIHKFIHGIVDTNRVTFSNDSIDDYFSDLTSLRNQ